MIKKNLYCDVDSTVNNHWVRLHKWARPCYPGDFMDPIAFTRDEIMQDAVLPNAVSGIQCFMDNGWNVYFLSARGFQDAYDITKSWLDQKKFSYTGIHCVQSARDKLPFILSKRHTKQHCHLLIDDFSGGQEQMDSYVSLYIDIIKGMKKNNINHEIFSSENNWAKLVFKYLDIEL